MCRLTGATMTDSSLGEPGLKSLLVHEAMLRSAAEESGQSDGWGVADGTNIWKSAEHYIESSPFWLNNVRTDGFILGHVRKASATTLRTVHENHPYIFDINGKQLIAAHNGWIDGTAWNTSVGVPRTDSWRALNDLAKLLSDTPEISADVVQQWLNMYTAGTHYAFLMLWDGALYAIKGNSRPLHVLPVGDGYLINTSEKVLRTIRTYLHDLYSIQTQEPIFIADHNIVRFELGSRDPQCTKFTVTPKAYTNRWQDEGTSFPNHLPPVGGTGVKSTEIVAVHNESDVSRIIAPSVTSPRRNTALAATNLAAIRAQWSHISGKLSPMRATLARFWAAWALGYSARGGPDTGFLSRCTETDLKLLDSVFFPVNANGAYDKPFNAVSNLMLNWWNHTVNTAFDVFVHDRMFGLNFFWLDATYTQNSLTKDANVVFNLWRYDTCKRIYATFTDAEIELMFDFSMLNGADVHVIEA